MRSLTRFIVLAAAFAALVPSATPRTGLHDMATSTSSYSIIGYDPITGEFGVAAASEAPLIGMNLEFFDLETGGVLIHGGPHLDVASAILIAMQQEIPPKSAISVGLAIDEAKEHRQVLALSLLGAAAFTGDEVEDVSADTIGENFVAAGQRLGTGEAVTTMAREFAGARGRLGHRLLTALAAGRDANEEGLEAHSAALLVISPSARFATRHRLVDLRIDYVEGDAVAALERLRFQIDSIYEVN